jgi:hypothetical protein
MIVFVCNLERLLERSAEYKTYKKVKILFFDLVGTLLNFEEHINNNCYDSRSGGF